VSDSARVVIINFFNIRSSPARGR